MTHPVPIPAPVTSVRRRVAGQILPLFAFSLIVIFSLAALLYDGAQALTLRRQMQDAGDAAALSAANVIQSGAVRGCSSSETSTPRTEVHAAAVARAVANMPTISASDVTVTCPTGWQNQAVEVRLTGAAPIIFMRVLGMGGFPVGTASTAVNGQITGSQYSVVLLDPGNPSWPNGQRGCPSFLLSGGPQIIMDSSIQVNSSCTAANGGALSTNGNAASLTVSNGARFRLVGEYAPGALTLNPAPLQHQTVVADPFLGITPMPVASMPVRSSARLVINGGSRVLQPGVYVGGIQLRSSATIWLTPGIYVMDGGGFSVGSQGSVFSIPYTSDTTSSVNASNWHAQCPNGTGTCGVMIFNTGTTSSMGEVTVTAGATVMLRAYDELADPSGFANREYRNLLVWQDASPVPTSSFAQPIVALQGGGSVALEGTIYSPSAKVSMGGNSGGSGGSSVDLTLQFIVWDLELSGNSSFHFRYSESEFAKPRDYGLVR